MEQGTGVESLGCEGAEGRWKGKECSRRKVLEGHRRMREGECRRKREGE